MATTEKVKLLTPKFRVNFPQVFEKQVFQEGQKGRYSCVAMFDTAYIKSNPNELKRWNLLQAAIDKVCKETFKKPAKELKSIGGYKLPIHRGEEKENYNGFGPGILFFTMSAYTRRPKIINRAGEEITADSEDEFYSGCYARASVNPFTSLKWKSVSIGMNNLQKLADGERLDAFSNAEDDFSGDASEYDDGGDSELDGDGDDFAGEDTDEL